jgi:hypothetical protein
MTDVFTDLRFRLRWKTQTIFSTSFFLFMIWQGEAAIIGTDNLPTGKGKKRQYVCRS